MQSQLEAEARGRSDILRAKKKLEHDINELEVALEGTNRGRAEAEKTIKKFQEQLHEVQSALEEQQKVTADARDQFTQAERRAIMAANEVDEIRTALEQSERCRKMAEAEAHEAHDRVSELLIGNGNLLGAKRKLETDLEAMHNDADDLHAEAKGAEEHAKKAMSDAARLAELVRHEQDRCSMLDKNRRTYETQVKDLQGRLDDAEANMLKGGKRLIQKLEAKVRTFTYRQLVHSDKYFLKHTVANLVNELFFLLPSE